MKHSFLLTDSTTLQEVILALDKGGIGFLAFVDKNNTLLGIITDGDLRRSILNKTTDVHMIVNKRPEKMHFNSPKKDIVSKLKLLHRRHMPLVDDDEKLISVFSMDDIEFVSRSNYVVIMAGGLGSRLGELTKETPKPMLKVGDRPMLQHLVEQFIDQGFSKFIFCVNYKRNIIQEHFLDGKKFGASIAYVVENKRLGTAGALCMISKELLSEPFFVINADILTSLDFNELLNYHNEKKSAATMCVRQFQQEVPYGVVSASEDLFITDIIEKPSFSFDVNAGIYVLNVDALDLIPQDTFFDMPTLFQSLIIEKKPCTMYRLLDYWVDIGRKEDLLKANADIGSGYLPQKE